MIKEEICQQFSKTVYQVSAIEDIPCTQKRIVLRPNEAKVLLSHGVKIFREELTKPDGTRFSVLCCYVNLEQLINAAK